MSHDTEEWCKVWIKTDSWFQDWHGEFYASSGNSENFLPDMLRLCHNTKEWYNIWGGTDLSFEKWHEEFSEFWLNTQKSQKFWLILVNFYACSRKSELALCTFMFYFCSKHIKF